MKILRILNTVTVVLNSGEILSSDKCTEEMFSDIFNHQDDEEYVKGVLIPEFYTKKLVAEGKKELFSGMESSKYLIAKGSSIYLPEISELSLPEDLVAAFIKAEKENDKNLIETYLNFWTLCSLNPDSRVRQNLFWFLNKYGMVISKSGLFIGYRNVDIKKEGSEITPEVAAFISKEYTRIKFINKKSPKNYKVIKTEKDDYATIRETTAIEKNQTLIGNLSELYNKLSDVTVSTIYTDHYSHTFEIVFGNPVTMLREETDRIQENSCSSGLHVGGKSWLQKNYFGGTGIMVLVNPADVVAVPPIDNYGKLRTCAYYPISVVDYDKNGNIIDNGIESGFEDDFLSLICYTGEKNKDDSNPYSITIPDIPEIERGNITKRLKKIASTINKVV